MRSFAESASDHILSVFRRTASRSRKSEEKAEVVERLCAMGNSTMDGSKMDGQWKEREVLL